jgi:cysteine desulfurase
MKADMLSLSAHKFYGPKGMGALYVQSGIEFQKLQDGGHQEKDKRAGTENVPGIVGMGKAIELVYKNFDDDNKKMIELRDYLINEVNSKIPNVKLNGSIKSRLAGNSNFSFEGIEGEELLLKLDEKGICASSGSACSLGSSEPSHVLTSIGLTKDLSYGTLRITIGKENTKEDIDYLIDNLVTIVEYLRNR